VTGDSRWEHFPHEADIGVRGIAPTLEGAFAQAALALTAVVADPAEVQAEQKVAVECGAPDAELLLVDWLNALVYEMAVRHLLFSRFEVNMDREHLHGTAWGEPVDPLRHRPTVEVKGATYTGLKVARGEDGLWRAECVVDV